MSEVFTDRDNFVVQIGDQKIENSERLFILATSIFIDLQYFERKAGK